MPDRRRVLTRPSPRRNVRANSTTTVARNLRPARHPTARRVRVKKNARSKSGRKNQGELGSTPNFCGGRINDHSDTGLTRKPQYKFSRDPPSPALPPSYHCKNRGRGGSRGLGRQSNRDPTQLAVASSDFGSSTGRSAPNGRVIFSCL
jgi:hypothetical protein